MKRDLVNLIIIVGLALTFAWLVREVRAGIRRVSAATAGMSMPKREVLAFFIIIWAALIVAAIIFTLRSGIVDRFSTFQVLTVAGCVLLLPPTIQWIARRMKRV